MVFMGQTMEEILMSRDTTIFLLQHLGFILNMEKSILNPVQEIEFLGLIVNSVKMTLSLPEQKIKWIQDQCQDLHVKGFVAVLELTKLIGLLASTIQVVLLAQLSISSAATDKCSKTQWAILRGPVLEQGVKERTTMVDSKFETLQWWIDNTTSVLCYNKNRCLQEGVGCTFSRDTNRRGGDIRGKGNAHKYFGTESNEVSFVISQTNENESSSFSNRQHISLDVLTKNGGYWEQETFGPGQGYMGLYLEEWDPDYSRMSAKLPERGSRLAVKEPQGQFSVETSSPNISSNLPNKRNFRDRPVASRLSHQLPKYFAWRPDPCSQVTDAMQHPWGSKYLCALPPFSMINKVLNKVKQDKVGKMLLVAPTWQSQTLYSILLSMSLEKPKLLPHYQHPLMNPQKPLPPLLINKTLMINSISAYAQC